MCKASKLVSFKVESVATKALCSHTQKMQTNSDEENNSLELPGNVLAMIFSMLTISDLLKAMVLTS